MIDEFIRAFVTLFVIVDPIGVLPVFVSLTEDLPRVEKMRNANHAIVVAIIIMLVFLFGGLMIFDFFGISIGSFQIAGGIILLIVGIMYVLGVSIKTHKHLGVKEDKDFDVSTVPIGTPLLAGPGVITTIIILVAEYGHLVTLAAVALTMLIVWVTFRFSDSMFKLFGSHGVKIVSRVMGIILAAIAIEFIRKGITSFLIG